MRTTCVKRHHRCNKKWSCRGLDVILSVHTGAIFIIESLDYESSHEYYLTVEATDGGTPSLSDVATVNINVTDINDNSPVFSQDTYTTVVSEDAALEQPVITVRLFPRSCLCGILKGRLVKSLSFLNWFSCNYVRGLQFFSQRTWLKARALTLSCPVRMFESSHCKPGSSLLSQSVAFK